METVSIVIPAYNAERFLQEAVESALRQTFPPNKLIVVDDGSEDHTYEIAESYGTSVEVVRHRINKGVSAARNAGAERTNSEWLLFLDADDVLEPNALRSLVSNTVDKRYGVIYGGVVEFDPSTGSTRPRGGNNAEGLPPQPAKANFKRAAIVTPGAAIVRHPLHKRIGGFTKPQPTEDRDYWMKLGVLTGFKYVDDVILRKRAHESQAVRKINQTLVQGLMVQLEYLQWLDEQKIGSGFLGLGKRQIVNEAIVGAIKRKRYCAAYEMVGVARKHSATTILCHLVGLVCLARCSPPRSG